jgi:predicted nucleic acid-binding protein
MLKIYLDNCCYNRPYDDQTNLKVSLQTQAKLKIQAEAINGECSLVWSFILEYENNQNPFEFKRNEINDWKEIAEENILKNDEITETANSLKSKGLRTKDALHIACAAYAKADYFITTDDKLLNKKLDIIKVISPIDYINIKEENEND